MKHLRALLINPFIYDFAAYNFWSTPLGLLYMGGILRANSIDIHLIDCLRAVEEKRRPDGRAPFIKQVVETPEALKGIKRRFKRYGISGETLKEALLNIEPPGLVLITSIMTYWYLGTKEVIELVKGLFPKTKVVVGGIYPTLCFEHAKKIMNGADLLIRNNEITRFYEFVEDSCGIYLPYKPDPNDLDNLPYPCFDLYGTIPFIPILTSLGCIYNCTYCATSYLHPLIIKRSVVSVLKELAYWYQKGVKRFILYDDNFLYKKEVYAKPLLKAIANLPFEIEFYNPNAINAAMIDEESAHLLFSAGFKEIRLGLESIEPSIMKTTGGKVDLKGFESAVALLLKAGFRKGQINAYILVGLPSQRWEEVKGAVDYLRTLGVIPNLAEYTPIPHTPMFDENKAYARFPLADEPLYQNNAVFPFAWDGFTEENLAFLKKYAKDHLAQDIPLPENPYFDR